MALSGVLSECDVRNSMRLAELGEAPDIGALLAYWDQDGTPGRVLNLQERQADVTALAESERLDESARAFLRSLERTETVHLQTIRRGLMRPGSIMRNLLFLFREDMTAELARVAEGLTGCEPPHDVFAGYAYGLHAELEKDTEAALMAYEGVISRFGGWQEQEDGVPEDFDILLEETLQRITQCYLERGEGEAAVGSLSLLAQVSPAYVSQHARLLHLLGCHEEALQVLESHVQSSPGDWKALLQMSDIYTAIGATEAANTTRRLAAEIREDVPVPARAA